MIKIMLYNQDGNWLRTIDVESETMNQFDIAAAIRSGLRDREREYYLKHYPYYPPHDCSRVDFYGLCYGCEWERTHKPEFKPSTLKLTEFDYRDRP